MKKAIYKDKNFGAIFIDLSEAFGTPNCNLFFRQ